MISIKITLMSYDENLVKNRIKNTLRYNSIIFLIFAFWFFYSSVDNILILFLICLLIFLVVSVKFITELRSGFTLEEKNIIQK